VVEYGNYFKFNMAVRSKAQIHANSSKQVCVQLPTSADNVTLLAFAAARRAAVRPAATAPGGCRYQLISSD